MSLAEQLIEEYGDVVGDVELMTADGFDEAYVGLCSKSYRVIYDTDIMVNILMERDKMTEEEALEYLDYNVLNAWVGDQTPIYMM